MRLQALAQLAASMVLLSAITCFADGSGTGFVLSRAGYIITNYHVIADAIDVQVIASDGHVFSHVKVSRKDTVNDLAVLQVTDAGFASVFVSESPLNFALASTKVGQDCFTLGFPLGDVMGTTARLSTGVVDSIFGLQDDPRLMQISNPLQPGNSGGPLLNRAGEVIGVVVSGLNAKFFYERAGIIPQNVNFAIKVMYLKALVESLGDDLLSSRHNLLSGLSLEKQAEAIAPFVVRVAVRTAAPPRPLQHPAPPLQVPPVGQQVGPPTRTFIPALRGQADVEYVKPMTKRRGDMVVTELTVKNASAAPILRLTIDETWYDRSGALITGSKGVVARLEPGETATLTIYTPFNPRMSSNNYNFSHANGTVKPRQVGRLP